MEDSKVVLLVKTIKGLLGILEQELGGQTKEAGDQAPAKRKYEKQIKVRKFKMVCENQECASNFTWEGKDTLDATCPKCGSVHVKGKRRPNP
jgi:hypothetical protein